MAIRPWVEARKSTRTDFSYQAIELMPRDVIGVYAFWSKSTERCIYVGRAKDQPIHKRLRSHFQQSHNRRLRGWITYLRADLQFCYAQVARNQVERVERWLIRQWRPDANIQDNPT